MDQDTDEDGLPPDHPYFEGDLGQQEDLGHSQPSNNILMNELKKVVSEKANQEEAEDLSSPTKGLKKQSGIKARVEGSQLSEPTYDKAKTQKAKAGKELLINCISCNINVGPGKTWPSVKYQQII